MGMGFTETGSGQWMACGRQVAFPSFSVARCQRIQTIENEGYCVEDMTSQTVIRIVGSLNLTLEDWRSLRAGDLDGGHAA